MRQQRVVQLCQKFKITLTEEEMIKVLQMSNRSGERKIREWAQDPAKARTHKDPFCVRGMFWQDQDMAHAANDRGRAKRAIKHMQDEAMHWFGMAAKIAAERDALHAIMKYAEGVDTEAVQEAKETLETSFHPQQSHLPFSIT
jgi:hypothetical protein